MRVVHCSRAGSDLFDALYMFAFQPCTDVYWFPMFSPQFCQELIDEVAQHDLWSGGKHEVHFHAHTQLNIAYF